MLRSLYSAVSGLNTHQTELDVIGNNIANVNTTAYKSQALSFSDLMYQTTRSASGATATTGSISAKQIGLGVMTGAISTNISTQGSATTTSYPFDMMISGSTFFAVNNGTGTYYTRDGSFDVDSKGDLVTRNGGYYVQGWTSTDGSTVSTTGAIGKLTLQSTALNTSAAAATSNATFTGNIDKDDTSVNSDNGKTLSLEVYGSDGKKYTLNFALTNGDDSDSTTYTLSLKSATDADGNSLTMGTNSDIKLVYNATSGNFVSANGNTSGNVTLNLPGTMGGTLTVGLAATTAYASTTTGSSTIKAATGDTDGNGKGRAVGTMNGITVSENGQINATYTNGATRLIGQIATASFANASGLEKVGDNLYGVTQNSGAATYVDVTADGGKISTGVLEASNVDLADEFTRMITAQRGFQANSRVITTSDSMLQELKNLKR